MKNNITQQNIPDGWKVLPIGKHLKLQGGNAFSALHYVADGIPLVRIGNVGKGDFVANDFVYISENEYAQNKSVHLRENDILMGMTGELGKVARIGKRHLPAILNQRVGRVVFKDKDLNPDFTFQLFLSKDFISKLEKYFIGAAQKNISSSQVESVEVLLPPVKEQQKIAEILGVVDEDIAKTQEVIEATEKLKRGLMQQLFTRGIGHTKFKETKIGQIPQNWEVHKLEIYIKSLDAGVSVNSRDVQKADGEIGILKTSAVTFGVFDPNQHKTVVSEEVPRVAVPVKAHRLIVSRMNTRDLVGANAYTSKSFSDLFLPDRLWQVEPKDERNISMHWLSYIFNLQWKNGIFASMATGTSASMKNLSKGSILNMELAFPRVEEQKEIAEILSAVDEKISVNMKLKEKLTLLKKGLMQDLLSGKVRTNI